MTTPRPRVFVSSTVYDFADLREALKFWLEEMGFDVQMSEFNDFERRPEAGTFEACFDSIQQSDYYILLIGQRRGSWYDEANRTSVTRQEYREAYASFLRTATPRISSFVRKDVLTVLRERKQSNTAATAPSTLQDPAFTSEFISEVRRDEETSRAAAGAGPFPPANWITQFATFRELVDGLKSSLRIREPLRRVAVLENLRHELEFNLRLMLTKHDGKPFYSHWWLAEVRREVQLSPGDLSSHITLTYDQVKHAMAYSSVGTIPPEAFGRAALQEAILSGALLDFDPERQRLVPSDTLRSLYVLRDELDAYTTRSLAMATIERWAHYWFAVKDSPGSTLEVPAYDLLTLFALHDSQQNVVRLLVAILRHLYGHSQTIDVMLRPTSPLTGMPEKIEAERVSEEEVRTWLEKDYALLQLGLRDDGEQATRKWKEMLDELRQALGAEKAAIVVRQAVTEVLQAYKRTPKHELRDELGPEQFERILRRLEDELLQGNDSAAH